MLEAILLSTSSGGRRAFDGELQHHYSLVENLPEKFDPGIIPVRAPRFGPHRSTQPCWSEPVFALAVLRAAEVPAEIQKARYFLSENLVGVAGVGFSRRKYGNQAEGGEYS